FSHTQRAATGKKNSIVLLVIQVLILLCSSAYAQNNSATVQPVKTGYADVNGLHMYYEVYGRGEPLILLHGGFGSTDMFSSVMPTLSAKRQVIAVDMQAHGRTADIDRPMTFEALSNDVVALLKYFKLDKADIMG